MHHAPCRIELLGGVRLERDGVVTSRFRTHKTAALLGYLALHSRSSQPRETIVEIFWPDQSPDDGRNNLSTALSSLRRHLEPISVESGCVLQADRRAVRLNPDAFTSDVEEFERLVKLARAETGHDRRRRELLERAVALYRGELLPGVYDDWAVREQARLAGLYMEALLQWEEALERAGEWDAALDAASRAVAQDTWSEAAWKAEVRAHAGRGDPAAALERHREYAALLRSELGARPSAEMETLARWLRQEPDSVVRALRDRVALTPPEPTSPIHESSERAEEAAPAAPARASLLPAPLTRFFGRAQEVSRLRELLCDSGRPSRLITLTGPGGVGKTRLAVETAADLVRTDEFAERMWFVSLADVPHPRLVLFAIAHALRIPLGPGAEPLDLVAERLAGGRSLLVLDNFEHLVAREPSDTGDKSQLAATALIRILLERAPELSCLVTSRRVLRVDGEQEFPVAPLPLPDEPPCAESPSPAALHETPSVALYVDRARLALPDFAITRHNAATVAALCRKLEGLPLAIEMAAAWAKTLTPARMLDQLEDRLGALVSRRQDTAPRQRSLRATLEWSFHLLPAEARRCLACLGAFRGGCTLEGAEAVAGPGALGDIAVLQDHSLVVAGAGDEERFRMLEVIRAFAQEKLDAESDADAVRARHAAWCLSLAEEAARSFGTPEQAVRFEALDVERDNMRGALDWFAARLDGGEAGLRLVSALWRYWHTRGMLDEGAQHHATALSHPAAQGRTPQRASALRCAGAIARQQCRFDEARALSEEGLAISRELGDRQGVASALNNLGSIATVCRRSDAAALFEEALAINGDIGDRMQEASNLFNLGSLVCVTHDFDRAGALYGEALAIWTALRCERAEIHALNGLGHVTTQQGRPDAASEHYRRALALCRDLTDQVSAAFILEGLAEVAVESGRAERAARLFGAANALRKRIAAPLDQVRRQEQQPFQDRLRAALGPDARARAWAEGEALTWEQAVALGLQEEAVPA